MGNLSQFHKTPMSMTKVQEGPRTLRSCSDTFKVQQIQYGKYCSNCHTDAVRMVCVEWVDTLFLKRLMQSGRLDRS